MDYLTLIIVAVVGIGLGAYFGRQRIDTAVSMQSKEKQRNKKKVLAFVYSNGEVRNNDVEKLLGVSNATAERYLDELEKAGKLTQHGTTGQNVFYSLK